MIVDEAWKLPLLASLGILGLFLGGWRPRAGLYALIALSPTQFIFFPVATFFLSPADMLVAGAVAAFAVRTVLGGPLARRALLGHRWLIVMVLGYVAGSWVLGEGSRTLVRLLLAMAPSLLMCTHLSSERSIRTAQACVIWAGAADAAYGAVLHVFGVPYQEGRLGAVAGPNFDATIILEAATVAWASWASTPGLVGAAGLTLFGMATLSRGGVIAFVVALAVAVAPVLRFRARWLLLGGVFVVSALAITTDTVPGLIETRMEQLAPAGAGSHSVEIREAVARGAWRAFLAQPFTGIGFGRFTAYSAEDPEIAEISGNQGAPTHNTPLEILAEGGLLASVPFGLYCWGMVRLARRALGRVWKFRDRSAAASLGSFVVVVVSSLFANTLLLYYTWIACGLLMAYARICHGEIETLETADSSSLRTGKDVCSPGAGTRDGAAVSPSRAADNGGPGLRILHCIHSLSEGGAELQLAYLAAAQARAGEDVHVALVRGGPRIEFMTDVGISLHALPTRGNHDPLLYWRLERLVARLRPQVLQTWLRQMDVLGGLAAGRRRVPWVLTERCSDAFYPPGWKSWARTTLGRRASAVVSNSRSGDAYWAPRLGPEVPRWVIPNVLPASAITAAPLAIEDAIGLPAGHCMIVAAGRLCAQKNLTTLIRAMRLLPSSSPSILFLCGVGSDEASLRRLAIQEGVEQRVRFPGFVSTIWSWLKRADVFVSVSSFEGQPNAVLEAVAARCPTVLSDIPAHRELLDDCQTVFVDPTSPRSIARGLARCLGDEEAASGRAAIAQESLGNRSPDEIAGRYRVVYDTILAKCSPRCRAPETPCAG